MANNKDIILSANFIELFKSYQMIQLLLLLLSPLENPRSPKPLMIAEADIKLRLDFNSSNRIGLEQILRRSADDLLRQYPERKDLSYTIEIEEGSVIGKVKTYAYLTMTFIISYGGLKDGLREMFDDGEKIAEYIIHHSQYGIAQKSNVIQSEAKTGYIGRLKKILDRVEYLKSNLNHLSNIQTQEELTKLYHDLANITELLGKQGKERVIQSLPDDIKNNIPLPSKKGVAHFNDQFVPKLRDTILRRRRR